MLQMIFCVLSSSISFFLSILINLIINNGLLGNNLCDKYNNYMKYNDKGFILILFIIISFISYLIIPHEIIYCGDGEIEKALANVKDNNVNIHNLNINLPNSLGKAIASLGVGGAVAAGMTTGSSQMKSGAPLGVKLGVSAIGGAIGGVLFVSTNYMNTVLQKKAEISSAKNSPNSDPNFSAKSILDNSGDDQALNAVLGLFNLNVILHICIVYLLIALAILYISNIVKLNLDY